MVNVQSGSFLAQEFDEEEAGQRKIDQQSGVYGLTEGERV